MAEVAGEYQQQISTDAPGIVPIAALPGIAVDLSGLGLSSQP
jgi:hypothetical protein